MFRPLAFDYPEDPAGRGGGGSADAGRLPHAGSRLPPERSWPVRNLPEDMLLITTSGPEDFRCRKLPAGHHYVKAAADEVIFFLKKGCVLPLAKPAESTARLDGSRLDLIVWPGEDGSYRLYDDDGISKNYEDPENYETICVNKVGIISCHGSRNRTLRIKETR